MRHCTEQVRCHRRTSYQDLREEHGIVLTKEQEWWYAAKSREQGEDMWKNSHPAEEAFKPPGWRLFRQKFATRLRKMIGRFLFESRRRQTSGISVSDSTIWLHQQIAGRHRFVGYYENSGEGIGHHRLAGQVARMWRRSASTTAA